MTQRNVLTLHTCAALSVSVVLAVVVFELTASGYFTPEPLTAHHIRERTRFYGKDLTRHQVQKALLRLETVGLVKRHAPAPGTVWITWTGVSS